MDAVLRLLPVASAAGARRAGGGGGVRAGALAGPRGRTALRIAGRGTLAPAGPAGPEPVHWTDRQTACLTSTPPLLDLGGRGRASSPGHLAWQVTAFVLGPAQKCPPYLGAGWLHGLM